MVPTMVYDQALKATTTRMTAPKPAVIRLPIFQFFMTLYLLTCGDRLFFLGSAFARQCQIIAREDRVDIQNDDEIVSPFTHPLDEIRPPSHRDARRRADIGGGELVGEIIGLDPHHVVALARLPAA